MKFLTDKILLCVILGLVTWTDICKYAIVCVLVQFRRERCVFELIYLERLSRSLKGVLKGRRILKPSCSPMN